MCQKYGFAHAVNLPQVKIVSIGRGNLANEFNDIDVKCEYEPPLSSVLDVAIGVTYKQIFSQVLKFIYKNNNIDSNNNNDSSKNTNSQPRYLEYPKLYMVSNKPKCFILFMYDKTKTDGR